MLVLKNIAMLYYLLPLSFRDILFSNQVLDKCEQSKTLEGYYVPENIYLLLKNKNLC